MEASPGALVPSIGCSAADGSKQADFAIGEGPAFAPRNGCNDGDVSRVQFTPDGNHLLLADLKGVVHLWDIAEFKKCSVIDLCFGFPTVSLKAKSTVRTIGEFMDCAPFLAAPRR